LGQSNEKPPETSEGAVRAGTFPDRRSVSAPSGFSVPQPVGVPGSYLGIPRLRCGNVGLNALRVKSVGSVADHSGVRQAVECLTRETAMSTNARVFACDRVPPPWKAVETGKLLVFGFTVSERR